MHGVKVPIPDQPRVEGRDHKVGDEMGGQGNVLGQSTARSPSRPSTVAMVEMVDHARSGEEDADK